MAAICATGDDRRPATISTTPKHSAKPATKAAAMRRMRLLRALISECLRLQQPSQAGGDPGEDHLVEYGCAVMSPERQCARQHHAHGRGDEHEGTRKHGLRGRSGFGHRWSTFNRPAGRFLTK